MSDIGFSLVIGPAGVFRRTRQYIPAARAELIADREFDAESAPNPRSVC
jgi:hypothetical protein